MSYDAKLRSHRTNQPIRLRLPKEISNNKITKVPSEGCIGSKFLFMNMIFVVNYFSMSIGLHLSLFRFCFRVFYHENPFDKEQLTSWHLRHFLFLNKGYIDKSLSGEKSH